MCVCSLFGHFLASSLCLTSACGFLVGCLQAGACNYARKRTNLHFACAKVILCMKSFCFAPGTIQATVLFVNKYFSDHCACCNQNSFASQRRERRNNIDFLRFCQNWSKFKTLERSLSFVFECFDFITRSRCSQHKFRIYYLNFEFSTLSNIFKINFEFITQLFRNGHISFRRFLCMISKVGYA